RRQPRPERLIGRQFVQPAVPDPQQPDLIQVRLRDPPGTAEVLERAVLEHPQHGAPRALVPRPVLPRLLQELLGAQGERLEGRAANPLEPYRRPVLQPPPP